MTNFQNKGKRAPRGTQGGPKRPKMAKNDQNLKFFGFCLHPSQSGKKVSLLLHRSNAERVEENESRE